MKKNIILFIMTLLLVSCKLTKDTYDSGELKKIGRATNDLKTENWKFYHKNGKIFQKGKYRDGKKIGIRKMFHENGKLHQIGDFNKGK
nr:hypothetical protein [Flavobacterium sp.]